MELSADEVLNFWLGPEAGRDDVQRKEWWTKDPAFDAVIRERFGDAIGAAGRGELDHLLQTPRGRLAVVILLDQFTRNAYRDTATMYDYDAYAAELAVAGIEAGEDRQLLRIERYFLYMPLMHAESLALQDRAVVLFQALADEQASLGKAREYAQAHRDIVARFGRFPHRNAILGRPSTEEEVAFLKEPGSSF